MPIRRSTACWAPVTRSQRANQLTWESRSATRASSTHSRQSRLRRARPAVAPIDLDLVELIGADAVGTLDGATVRFLVSRPVVEANGDHVIGQDFEDLAGAIIAPATASPGPDNTVGIAAELTAQRPGRFEVTNVRLRYRLNGGSEQVGEGIDVV